ncbi:MAG: hypothetical protein ACMXYF_03555 [Candidatus Woesearchaeota archaeon]
MAEAIKKQRYRCISCNYRFSRQIGIDFNNICPYCGKKSVVKEQIGDAQKLINEVTKLEHLYD